MIIIKNILYNDKTEEIKEGEQEKMDFTSLIKKYNNISLEDLSKEEILNSTGEIRKLTDIFYDIFNLMNTLESEYTYEDGQEELKLSNIAILREIYLNPGITANSLAKKYTKSAAYMSRTLRWLEDRDYIVREIDPENRIYFNIYLTKKGQSLVASHQFIELETVNILFDKFLKEHSQEELVRFVECIEDAVNFIKS